MSLTQTEFDYLIRLKKKFKEDAEILLGPSPISWCREILSLESSDLFLMDFWRGKIEIKKFSLNKRYRNSLVLLRYDCCRHTNPENTDGMKFKGPHIHLYREGFGDRWAFPISEIGLRGDESMEDVIKTIIRYLNIIDCPGIQTSLI